mgnify:CR=1 FL=1
MLGALLGLAVGYLLFGGRSNAYYSTTVEEVKKITIPILIAYNKHTRLATLTCPRCGGVGTEEVAYEYASCPPYKHDVTCRTCNGEKIVNLKVPTTLWKEAEILAKKWEQEQKSKKLQSTTKSSTLLGEPKELYET